MEHRFEPGELLGGVEHDRPHSAAIHRSVRSDLGTPALDQAIAHPAIVEQLVDDGIARQRHCPESREGGEGLRLSSSDAPR